MIELEPHRRYLRAICYRMTGSAADADDLVQQTFTRAIEAPPHGEVRPWLARVAVNLSCDLLRARKVRGYEGPWLPSPVETEEVMVGHEPASSTRYDLLESVSFAFLLALEALTPSQRAVLILRDVFDYSVRETADALDLSEANVKTTHHRARAAMEGYDGRHKPPADRARAALQSFLGALAAGDVAAVEAMLRNDVRALNDGGGEFSAAIVPLLGRARVLKFMLKVAELRGPVKRAELRELNGAPALVAEYESRHPREAPHIVMLCDLDADGLITEIYTVLATNKLSALFPA